MARLSAVVGTLALLFLHPALAVPNVTAIRIDDNTCQKFPGALPLYGGDHTDASRNLQFVIDQADDSAVDGLYAYSIPFEYLSRPSGQYYPPITGFTFDLRKSHYFAREVFRCFKGVLHLADGGPTTFGVFKDEQSGYILETNATLEAALNTTVDDPWPGYAIGAYAHYDPVTNERLPGVFLGAVNSTVWNFAYRDAGSAELAYRYDAWLQFDPNGPKDNETWFQGFIQVVEYP